MKNVIYAYKRKTDEKIVYVGQTVNLKNRHYRHIKIDPWDCTLVEYNYPLSRGIRKYGEDGYELIVLEEGKDIEKLNEREIYYIKKFNTYYDGYNQTIGGSNRVMPTYEDDLIDVVISLLKDHSIKFEDISKQTGLSLTHIYNINSGERRKRETENYPIRPSNVKGTRGLKFSQDEVIKIHELLLTSNRTMKDIAKEYGCNDATIRKINKGERKAYVLDGYNYPLRK